MKVDKFLAEYALPPAVIRMVRDFRVHSDSRKYQALLLKSACLRQAFEGRRCFLLGSGNSVKGLDLSLLRDECVFSLNNFFVHSEYAEIIAGKGEKFHMIAPIHPPQSEDEWLKWVHSLEVSVPENVTFLLGLDRSSCNLKYLATKYRLFSSRNVFWYYAGLGFTNSIDINITRPLIGAEAVSLYAIIAALYMGFKEIYLIGMDHDYLLYEQEQDMRMYESAPHQINGMQRIFKGDFYIMEFKRQYNLFKKYRALSQQYPGRIYKVGREGLLREFECIEFDRLFI